MANFFLRTFGCQMNKSDSERIAGVLIEYGYDQVLEPQQADVIVFNTCCVRQHAEDRFLGNANSLKSLKESRKDLIIVVGGCLAQKQEDKMFSLLPHIDLVFGTHNISNLPKLIDAARKNSHKVCEIRENHEILRGRLPAKRNSRFFAWVPVSIGCDNYCSYCVVPYVRGRESSLPIEEIKAEVEEFVGEGGKEVTLLGQNVNSYGRDSYGDGRFAQLLIELEGIEGLERIRFTTSHPKDLSKSIINAISDCPKVCEHIHLPIQAGSDKILELMNRGYTQSQYLKIVDEIRDRIPDCSLTTDIMVGFPGESEKDFEYTLDVVKKAGFDQAFMFIYSPREGTSALDLPDQIKDDVKKERFLRLVELQDNIAWEINKRQVGRRLEILVEGLAKKDHKMMFGRTRTNKVVNFSASDIVLGTTVQVEVIEALKKSLIGRVC